MAEDDEGGLRVGDRVEPIPSEVMALQGEQTVVGVYSHPLTGEWLWLATDDGVVRSFATRWWKLAANE